MNNITLLSFFAPFSLVRSHALVGAGEKRAWHTLFVNEGCNSQEVTVTWQELTSHSVPTGILWVWKIADTILHYHSVYDRIIIRYTSMIEERFPCTFDETVSFALRAIRKEGLKLKPEQLQAICHVYDGKDVFLWLPTVVWKVGVLRDAPLSVRAQGTKQY